MRSRPSRYAYFAAAGLLTLAMEAMLYFASRDTTLTVPQYAAASAAVALVALFCVWVLTWE